MAGVVLVQSKLVVSIAGTRLEKGASSWFRSKKAQIAIGQGAPRADWQEFAQEIFCNFLSHY